MSQSGEPKEDSIELYEILEPLMIAGGEAKDERRDDTQSFVDDAVARIAAHTQRQVIKELEKVKLIYRNFDIDWQYLDMLIEELRDK